MVGAAVGSCQALPRGGLSSGKVLCGKSVSSPPGERPDFYAVGIRNRMDPIDLQPKAKSRFVALAKDILIFDKPAEMEIIRNWRILKTPQINIGGKSDIRRDRSTGCSHHIGDVQGYKVPHGWHIFRWLPIHIALSPNIKSAGSAVVCNLDRYGIKHIGFKFFIRDRNRYPRSFFVLHHLNLSIRSIGTLLSSLCRSQCNPSSFSAGFPSILSSRLHNVGLLLNRPQSLVDKPSGYSPDNHKKPVWNVCRGQQFLPWILGRLLGGVILLICACWALDCDNWFGRIGGFLLVFGFVVLAAPVPWDLGPCPTQPESQHSEYRQASQHNGENVSQKHMDVTGSPVEGLEVWKKTLDAESSLDGEWVSSC